VKAGTERSKRQHSQWSGRRKRIAKGTARSVEGLNRRLKQFCRCRDVENGRGGMAGWPGGAKRPRSARQDCAQPRVTAVFETRVPKDGNTWLVAGKRAFP